MATDTITALGAGSGVDIKALAKSLTDAEGTPAKDAIKKKISKSNANISGYAAIKFVASNLSAAFIALKNESSFNSITPGNSQPAALSVVAGAKAATGSHSVSVTTLAAAQRNTSAGFATAGTALNGGAAFKLWFAVNGAPAKSIDVSAATPEGVVVAINKAALGVSAQLVNTGDATAPFKLMVSGTTGAANDFTLKSDNGSSGITVTTTQGATAVNETSSLAFGTALTAGQTITVGGLPTLRQAPPAPPSWPLPFPRWPTMPPPAPAPPRAATLASSRALPQALPLAQPSAPKASNPAMSPSRPM